ncbi:MAG: alpha-amylase family glycosyl hydrolase [Anaerolineaceae bacterium]|nr:alpha-amylase family glycosyl hydrolase [Anaerolineaceae bacterium]
MDTPIYADHIFGLTGSPSQRLKESQQRLNGVHHWGEKRPFRPEPGDRVLLHATSSSDLPIRAMRVAITVDDWNTQTSFTMKAEELSWDTLAWGWLKRWSLLLPSQQAGTLLRYKIWAELAGEGAGTPKTLYADSQASCFEEANAFAIWYGADQTPGWAKEARIYQIFVDRFNPGERGQWLQKDDLRQPMGGTLRGIIEKLPYIADMGFNCLWLTPIFASPSHHGYDASHYFRIEPRLGTEKDLRLLMECAHALGLRILLDFVANHSSVQHPAMQQALADRSTADWYQWKKWPKYAAFFGVKEMPNFNLAYGSPARAHLLEAARYWLEFGADGYRCDYANGPSADFWVDFRKVCREAKPNSWFFGEVIRPADEQRAFVGGLDGTLDFLTCQAIRESLALGTWKLSRLAGSLTQSEAYFPPEFSRPAFIDNHDMNRFLFSARGDERLLRMALCLLYLLPQPPVVYYGTENLCSQEKSIHSEGSVGFDEARLPMDWQAEPRLAGLLKQLADLRQNYPQFLAAPWQCDWVDDAKGSLLLTKRLEENETWQFYINRGADWQLRLAAGEKELILGKECGASLAGDALSLQAYSCALIHRP